MLKCVVSFLPFYISAHRVFGPEGGLVSPFAYLLGVILLMVLYSTRRLGGIEGEAASIITRQ